MGKVKKARLKIDNLKYGEFMRLKCEDCDKCLDNDFICPECGCEHCSICGQMLEGDQCLECFGEDEEAGIEYEHVGIVVCIASCEHLTQGHRYDAHLRKKEGLENTYVVTDDCCDSNIFSIDKFEIAVI
jgi:hypothetical protein